MATRRNLVIDQGATFSLSIDVADQANVSWNIAGYSGRGAMKKHYDATVNAASFGVSLNANTSTVTITLDPEDTIDLEGGRYVYDIDIYTDSLSYRIIEGMVNLTPMVTKP